MSPRAALVRIYVDADEIAAARENKAKMVALNQRDAQTKWGQLEVFMTRWRLIEALIAQRGPFIQRVSRTAMTRSRSTSLLEDLLSLRRVVPSRTSHSSQSSAPVTPGGGGSPVTAADPGLMVDRVHPVSIRK